MIFQKLVAIAFSFQNKQSIEWIIVDPFQRDLSALGYFKLALRVGIPPGSLGLLLQEKHT